MELAHRIMLWIMIGLAVATVIVGSIALVQSLVDGPEERMTVPFSSAGSAPFLILEAVVDPNTNLCRFIERRKITGFVYHVESVDLEPCDEV